MMIKKFLAGVVLVTVSGLGLLGDVPVSDSGTVTFTTSGSKGAYCQPQAGQSTAYFQLINGTSGPIDAIAQTDNGPTDAPLIIDKNGVTHAQPYTPPDSEYFRLYWIGGGNKVGIVPDAGWSGQTASFRMRCTSTVEGFSPGSSGSGTVVIIGPLCGSAVCIALSPSPAPWPQSTPGGIPQVNPADPTGNAYSASNPYPVVLPSPNDPCLNPFINKSYAKMNISTASTTDFIALSSGKTTTICGLRITVASAEQVQVAQFAGAGCTSTETVIDTLALQSGEVENAGPSIYGAGAFAASTDTCIINSAAVQTTVKATYVQQ